MKRLALFALVILASCAFIFAANEEGDELDSTFDPVNQIAYSHVLSSPFTKTSARISAMGGAGLAVFNNQDSLYINPASLGEKGLVFNIPNVSVTLYNIMDAYYETGLLENAIENPGKLSDMDYLVDEVLDGVIGVLSAPDRNKLATVDAGIGFKFGRFAFAVDSQVNLNTYVPYGGGTADLKVIPQVDLAATVGIGLRFFRDSLFNLDVGVSAALQMRGFMQAVDAQSALDMLGGGGETGESMDPMGIVDNRPLALGWAVPLTVGVNINMPFGFTIANVVSNIQLVNGGYNYTFFDNYQPFVDDTMGSISSIFKGIEGESFVSKSPMNYSIGLGWAPDLGGWEWLLDPTIAIDVTDVIGLAEDFSTTNFLSRLKVGAELQLFKAFELRGGLNSGYVTLGAGVNLFNIIHLEASYYWNEFGDTLGTKDVDALTIRINIGWER